MWTLAVQNSDELVYIWSLYTCMTFKDILPGLSRTLSFNFQDCPGPKWFSKTFHVLEFSRKNPGLSRRRGKPALFTQERHNNLASPRIHGQFTALNYDSLASDLVLGLHFSSVCSLIIINNILSGVLSISAFYLTFYVAFLLHCIVLYSVYVYCIVAIQPFGCNTTIKFIHSRIKFVWMKFNELEMATTATARTTKSR